MDSVESFKASDLQVTLNPNAEPLPPMKGVAFGSIMTPHMVIIDFADGKWGKPRIEPFANFSLPPQTISLHYGTTCFEGMKAYADVGDIEAAARGETPAKARVRLFRPDKNAARLKSSMERLCFPTFDTEEFIKVLCEYVKVESAYVPKEMGYSLYLRPNAIGMDPTLAVHECSQVRLYVIASPVGPYYAPAADGSAAVSAVKLYAEEHHKRAWPGGTGASKLGANYAGPLRVQHDVASAGYGQVLWLGPHNEVQEVGAMNFCCVWEAEDGQTELVTAPLDGSILPGVTRDSILAMVRGWGGVRVAERVYTIDELVAAAQAGRVRECFGCGTAAIVTPVKALSYRGAEYAIPCPGEGESLTLRILKEIQEIQYGVKPSEWSVLIETD